MPIGGYYSRFLVLRLDSHATFSDSNDSGFPRGNRLTTQQFRLSPVHGASTGFSRASSSSRSRPPSSCPKPLRLSALAMRPPYRPARAESRTCRAATIPGIVSHSSRATLRKHRRAPGIGTIAVDLRPLFGEAQGDALRRTHCHPRPQVADTARLSRETQELPKDSQGWSGRYWDHDNATTP